MSAVNHYNVAKSKTHPVEIEKQILDKSHAFFTRWQLCVLFNVQYIIKYIWSPVAPCASCCSDLIGQLLERIVPSLLTDPLQTFG